MSEDKLGYGAINDLNTVFHNYHIGILVRTEQEDIILKYGFSLQVSLLE